MIKSIRALMASSAAVATLWLAPSAMAQQAAPAPAPVAVPQAEGQGPAMWVIRDEDSTLYLFGSFHLLKPTTAWGQAHVDAAFSSADEIWFELSDMGNEAQAMPLIQQLGLSPDRPLSSIMTAEDIAKLDAVAQKLGANAAMFDPMRPWFVSMQLALVQLMIGGFDPNAGVEKVLMARAAAEGKPIKGFETLREQLELMAGISEEGQIAMLRASLDDLAETPDQMEKLMNAWATGNVPEIETALVTEMKAEQPEAYEALLTRRNANWTRQIKQLLEGSGTAFIAVGAAHLAGPDSVQSMLAAEGITAERVTH
ncbi:TraB/GumN family protein [uncultured Brevundimonas sp.]|uniref:TraB/GumN family protein n=1 Tax=uncultured Brevundimonas sp. TaxID=213418 RepID=UPI00262E33DF|nr:TraB/GumN family protein [uncultured Brevundimonas sp.]